MNVIVPAELKRITKAISGLSQQTIEEMTLDAFRLYYDVEVTPDTRERRKACVENFKRLTQGRPLPFEAGRSAACLPARGSR